MGPDLTCPKGQLLQRQGKSLILALLCLGGSDDKWTSLSPSAPHGNHIESLWHLFLVLDSNMTLLVCKLVLSLALRTPVESAQLQCGHGHIA